MIITSKVKTTWTIIKSNNQPLGFAMPISPIIQLKNQPWIRLNFPMSQEPDLGLSGSGSTGSSISDLESESNLNDPLRQPSSEDHLISQEPWDLIMYQDPLLIK